jgi:hypothetical protein
MSLQAALCRFNRRIVGVGPRTTAHTATTSEPHCCARDTYGEDPDSIVSSGKTTTSVSLVGFRHTTLVSGLTIAEQSAFVN